jgi:hypothetical protein
MKREIDKYFSDNYSQLVEVTTAYINRLGKGIDAESVVADAYLYISTKKGITQPEIGRLTVGFIYRELYLFNSKTNRQGLLYSSDDLPNDIISNQTDKIILFIDIQDFEKTLDRLERNVWEAFYHKGLTTKRELGDHFKIDPTSAWKYVNTIKQKLKEYVKSEERI